MNKTIVSVLAISILAAAGSARGDDLPKEVKEIGCLAGAWKFAGSTSMGGQRAAVRGTWKCSPTPGHFGVSCNIVMTGVPGMAQYIETDLFGYDPGAGKYHWFSVTNAGETHDHVGAMVGANEARFQYDGIQDGKPFREIITLAFHGEKALHVRSESFVGGKSVALMEGDARK